MRGAATAVPAATHLNDPVRDGAGRLRHHRYSFGHVRGFDDGEAGYGQGGFHEGAVRRVNPCGCVVANLYWLACDAHKYTIVVQFCVVRMRCVSDGCGRTAVALLIAVSDGHEFWRGLPGSIGKCSGGE